MTSTASPRSSNSRMCHQQVKWLQSEDEKGVILGNLLLRGQQCPLTAILKHYEIWKLAFFKFVPQEECWKCCSFMIVPDHTCLHTTTTITKFGWQWCCTHPTVLTLHRQVVSCLVLEKTVFDNLQHYACGEALQNVLCQWLHRKECNFYVVRIHGLVQR